jgi:hypothetical protein
MSSFAALAAVLDDVCIERDNYMGKQKENEADLQIAFKYAPLFQARPPSRAMYDADSNTLRIIWEMKKSLPWLLH